VPAADKAALEDIAQRGAVESSLVGPGAKAAAERDGGL
jgi:hypothetical protein